MATEIPIPQMKYRFLGSSGLYVSALSFGSWMTEDHNLSVDAEYPVMEAAFKAGVNYFDNAESYAGGKAETVMGQAIQRGIERGVWKRSDLVVSTKIYFGADRKGPNDLGCSRKHIVEGVQASLKRFNLEYVDLLFCHRLDPRTPIEETVRAMNFAIKQGWAFYWGTSEWDAASIIEACDVADRLGMMRPLFDQAQYNIFERSRVDYDFVTLYKKFGYGLTTWSPLDSGILTGKYNNGIPADSRFTSEQLKHWCDTLNIESKIPKVVKLAEVAKEVGCTLAQLALAWCVSNKHVSTVIMGASSVKQVEENLKALTFVDKITPEIKQKIDDIIKFAPQAWVEQQPAVSFVRDKFL